MKNKIIVVMLISFLLLPSFISANKGKTEGNENEILSHQCYNVYTRTFFVFGLRNIYDSFGTLLDCKELSVNAKTGFYFTGEAVIYIKSEEYHRDVEHTIWGTGWYIYGRFVYPQLRYFESDWFVPGNQHVKIGATGFGTVTFWVNDSSE
ncbi:MAG TPA: hypothetical protein ENG06_06760 [Thermoplasmatales archaeon]|nr:hypothetical protein [Thermoplasmatales archaeon]